MHILLNLSQAYEAEFSAITHKKPNNNGIFELDTIPKHPYIGYILYKNKTPIGFCIANIIEHPKDISEFYIIPSMRHQQLGMKLAHKIFNKH